MARPNVIIMSGYGINCEEETAYAFELAGARAKIIHINDIIEDQSQLDNCQILAFPGGFSYGDDTGSGKAYAAKVKHHLMYKIHSFVSQEKLVIGICNGFQIIANLGLLPALDGYGTQGVALVNNNNARYIDRWVDLEVSGSSPWLSDMSSFSVPIAHGEGKFYASDEILTQLRDNKLIALRYTKGEISNFFDLTPNPNGSLDDIAGITDITGRVLGLMPHPERAISFTQLPHWTWLKEEYRRAEGPLPVEGPGLQIFKNAVGYFK